LLATKIPNVMLLPANLDLAGAEVELIGEVEWRFSQREPARIRSCGAPLG